MESGSHFKDSVAHVQFSHDGVYLAAADLSGIIKVWKLNGDISSNKEIVWEFETSDISVNFATILSVIQRQLKFIFFWTYVGGIDRCFISSFLCPKLISETVIVKKQTTSSFVTGK